MQVQQNNKQISDLIHESHKIVIAPAKNSGLDGLASAVGIYRSLRAMGKEVKFIYPYQLPYDAGDIISKNEIVAVSNRRDLVVNIDFEGTQIEKVNYYIEGNICKIILSPVSKDFDTKRVTFNTSSFDYDLFISVGAQRLEDHGVLHNEYGADLKKAKIINIDNNARNENFGVFNVVEPEVDSLSQLALVKLTTWGYKIDKDVATALLKGISTPKKAIEQKPQQLPNQVANPSQPGHQPVNNSQPTAANPVAQ